MDIGSKVVQIGDGHAHFGVIEDKRKNVVTEFYVRWHKGYATWERAVSLDLDEPLDA